MSTDLSTNAVDGCTPETILSRVDEAICALNTDCRYFTNESNLPATVTAK